MPIENHSNIKKNLQPLPLWLSIFLAVIAISGIALVATTALLSDNIHPGLDTQLQADLAPLDSNLTTTDAVIA